MQQVYKNIKWFSGSKTVRFLKESFFFALLYSTMLYVLVRLFFYEFPFTISEGFELHSKILVVVWVFIITCKLALITLMLLENSINEIKAGSRMYVPALKKSILVLVAAALSSTSKASTAKGDNISPSDCSRNTPADEPIFELN